MSAYLVSETYLMYSVFALSDGGRGQAGFPTITTPVDTVLTIVDFVVSFVPMVRTVVKTTERCHIINYLPTVAGTCFGVTRSCHRH